MLKHYSEILSAKFDNLFSTFFRIPPRSTIIFLSHCTRAVTLFPRLWNHLKKSLTRLKSNLCWNTIASFWARNLKTYRVLLRIHPRSKFLSLSDCTRTVTLLSRRSIDLNKSLTRLKSNLCWNTIASFEREIWQRIEYFFRIHPRSKFFSLSDFTRTVTLLPRPSLHLNKSVTRLKSNLRWNNYISSFWARNLTTYRVLFRIHPRSNFLPLRLYSDSEQWHSSLDPQFIWISAWLGRKAIYVETLYIEFLSAKFDNVSCTFFVYTLDQKIFLYQTVLGSYTPP